MLNNIPGRIITAAIIFIILDLAWLGYIAKHLYIDAVGSILRMESGGINANWPAAIMVYIALVGGICTFVLPKANGCALQALLWGAVFGFVTYATYDFTNLAVLKAWTFKISVIDTIWGMVICGLTSCFTMLITKL